jgi:hypothetical protein
LTLRLTDCINIRENPTKIEGAVAVRRLFHVTRRRELERKFQENFWKQLGTTYSVSGIALDGTVMNRHICLPSIDSSALGVACPPPGIGAKF